MGRGGTNPGSLLQGRVTLRPGDSRDLHCVAPCPQAQRLGPWGSDGFPTFFLKVLYLVTHSPLTLEHNKENVMLGYDILNGAFSEITQREKFPGNFSISRKFCCDCQKVPWDSVTRPSTIYTHECQSHLRRNMG